MEQLRQVIRYVQRGLTQFLSAYIVQHIQPLLRGTQNMSGATDDGHAVDVTKCAGPCTTLRSLPMI